MGISGEIKKIQMLIGEYQHNLDPKKRLAVPAKLRAEIGPKAVITRGLDSCLFIYPLKEWDSVVQKLNQLPMGQENTRSFVRLMLAGAQEVEIDGLGRVLVPDYLKKYAGLEKEVVITGVFNRLEIWNKKKWEKYKEAVEKDTDKLAERLGDLGVF